MTCMNFILLSSLKYHVCKFKRRALLHLQNFSFNHAAGWAVVWWRIFRAPSGHGPRATLAPSPPLPQPMVNDGDLRWIDSKICSQFGLVDE